MENFDYWRLCDYVSIFQATMLTLGFDPEGQTSDSMQGDRCGTPLKGYVPIKTAIMNAAKQGDISIICYSP